MRYFIYCRKSSEGEDRQVASIELQLTTLKRTFGDRADMQVVGVYEEAYSAKAPGRPQFNEMISKIEKGTADGIIAWAPDRLARNSIDGGRLIYMLDRGTIHDLKFATYTFENNSQGKFMLQIMFGQSKYYSDALSDNVKRGNQTKVEKGWRPNAPPIGYRNDAVTRTIVRDPDRFGRIRQIFDLMLSGAASTRQIWHIARLDWDFRTLRRGRMGDRPIALSYIHKILTNPFYAGVLMWNGKAYSGAHEPVLSLEEFDRVQAMLGRSDKPRRIRRSFAFTGMIRCGECGSFVTAEEKVNRHGSHYTYYHCTRRRIDYKCRQASTSKAALEDQIKCFLSRITISEAIYNIVLDCVRLHADATSVDAAARKSSLQLRVGRTAKSIENLTSLRIRDLIADDEFLAQRQTLEMEQMRIREQLATCDQAADTFEPFLALISFRRRAVEWFCNGTDEDKRLVFKTAGSNPFMKDKILSVEAKKPFRLADDLTMYPQLRAGRDDVRTLMKEKDPELFEVLENIHTLEKTFGTAHEVDDRIM